MNETLRDIRIQLRLNMNGVISSSMREKGMNYRLIFGVPLPEIKLIATRYRQDAELAQALWNEDIREFKILATLLMPEQEMNLALAQQWAKEIPYPEIASACCSFLFYKTTCAEELIASFITGQPEPKQPAIAYLTAGQILLHKKSLTPQLLGLLKKQALTIMNGTADWNTKQAVIFFLKQYGRISPCNSQEILSIVEPLKEAESPELQEFYNDLAFEFEYYFQKKE